MPLENSNICFIGAGAMGTAMMAGLIKRNLVSPTNIIASDPSNEQLAKLQALYPVAITHDNAAAVQNRDIVVLSIKPQTLAKVGAELQGKLPADALVISILAGATISGISHKLGHERVVRVMPNTPALVGKGISVWTHTKMVSELQKQQAKTILNALGEEVYVDDEDYLDMATALSGSGPAYVFLFMESLVDAGVHMGFSRRVAEQLVYQTVDGSVEYARQSKTHLAELRNMVTSPGGTTAEALYQFNKGGFRTVISKGIWAAYQKSRYLGSLDNNE
jgi:pyrroline-5-carboxylate reductase